MPPSANLAFIATKATLFGGLRRADFQTGPLPAASRSRADTGPTRPCRSAWLSRGAGPAAGPPSGRARELEPRRRDRSPNGTRTGRGCLDGSFGLDLEAAVRAGPAGSCAFRGVGCALVVIVFDRLPVQVEPRTVASNASLSSGVRLCANAIRLVSADTLTCTPAAIGFSVTGWGGFARTPRLSSASRAAGDHLHTPPVVGREPAVAQFNPHPAPALEELPQANSAGWRGAAEDEHEEWRRVGENRSGAAPARSAGRRRRSRPR